MTRIGGVVALVALLGWAACGGPRLPWDAPPAAALDLRLTWQARPVQLLEPFTVHLDCYRRSDLEVEFAPQVDASDFQSEVVALPERPFGPGAWRRVTLHLQPLRGPGELTLPAFTARARDGSIAASTEPVTVTVASALGDRGGALEAPGELFVPARRWPYFAAAGTLLAVCGIAWWLRRAPRLRGIPADTVQVPAHVEAQRALLRLQQAPRTTPAQIEAFYVGLSDVLRTYVERRFGLHAPERTTEEFLRELEGGDQLARGHRTELQQFLRQCDLVKFAAMVPDETVHQATFELAAAFVESTRPDRAAASGVPAPQEVGA